MMLHRHFDGSLDRENMTKQEDVSKEDKFVSEVFPPEEAEEAPKRRGRPKKSA